MTKPIKMWAIRQPYFGLFAFSLQHTRPESIKVATEKWGRPWSYYYRHGYRCVRVEVREIEG